MSRYIAYVFWFCVVGAVVTVLAAVAQCSVGG